MAGIVAVNHVALVNRNFSANRTRACQFGNRAVVRAAAQLNRTSIPLHRQQHAPLDVRRAFIDRVNVANTLTYCTSASVSEVVISAEITSPPLVVSLKSLNRNFQSNQRLRFQNRVDFRFGEASGTFSAEATLSISAISVVSSAKTISSSRTPFYRQSFPLLQNRSGPILFPILIFSAMTFRQIYLFKWNS